MFGRRDCPHATVLPAAARNCRREIPIPITYTNRPSPYAILRLSPMRMIPVIAFFLSTLPVLAQSVPGSGKLMCVSRSGNFQVEVWRFLREQLEGKNADAIMAKIQGKPIQRLPGTILPNPGNQPKSEFLISVEDGKSPDAILRFKSPWTGPALQPGMEIEFDAVAVALHRNHSGSCLRSSRPR